MKKISLLLPLLFFFCLTLSDALAQRTVVIKEKRADKRLALVIGNGAYKSAPLKNPLNDARDMASMLRKLGFQVLHEENATKKQMDLAIRRFGQKLRGSGTGLFYFAGHGMQVKGRNYLIPVDAAIENESDVEYEAIDAGRILSKMEDARNPINIVILDACRDNPFARSFRSAERGLARMDAPVGSIIAYATAPGSVAADGKGRNGIYTKHLLDAMRAGHQTIEQVFKRVRNAVIIETKNKQVPWESTSLRGDFYFIAKGAPPPALPEARPLTEKEEPEVIVVLATEFLRGVDVAVGSPWGADVLLNAPDYRYRPNAAEFEFTARGGTYRLSAEYAAETARPVRILLNGRLVLDHALGATTGCWYPQCQKLLDQGSVELRSGFNVMRVERDNVFPHIRKFVFQKE